MFAAAHGCFIFNSIIQFNVFVYRMFLNILKESPNCDEIMFFEDGSWRPASEIEGIYLFLFLVIPQGPKKFFES